MNTSNLLQLYINNGLTQNKQDRNLDINKVLSSRTFIRPLPAKGELVRGGILNAPYNVAHDTVYDIKSFHKSLKGTANDHELGKINDIGMKLGGLAIAGYLMTKKQNPFAKIMEIIGFASFFASMKLWPKIALQLPAKLIHGVNIRQEYTDSNGRKKMFYQDPQYIPWDLMSDKQINKVGDKMNVPADMPNRRDFIQEKMRKVAVQNNTMWMMTAGFATPIMSAMICKLCENPVKNLIASKRSKDADALLMGINSKYTQFKDTQMSENLAKIYRNYKNSPITEEILKFITDSFTKGMDEYTAKAISTDLKAMLIPYNKTYTLNDDVADRVLQHVGSVIKSEIPEFEMPDIKSYKLMLEQEGLLNSEINEVGVKEVRQAVLFKIKRALMDLPNADKAKVNKVISELVSSKELDEIIRLNPTFIFDENTFAKLKQLSETMTTFNAKRGLLNEYAYLKFADAPDTVIANSFNNVTDSLLKTFKFTDKEIRETRHTRDLVGEVLRNKLEEITSNDAEYKRVVSELSQKISELEKTLGTLGGSDGSYISNVNSVFNSVADEIRSMMPRTAVSLVGENGDLTGSLKNVQLSFPADRLLGVKSTFYRILNMLDFYKRVSDVTNLQALHKKMPLEMKEEIIEFAKQLTLNGTASDYMTKFFAQRNPNPSPELGEVSVVNGKVQNQFFGKIAAKDLVNLPDETFYRETMKLLYENTMHPETESLLSGTLLDNLKRYREDYIHEMGDYYYFAKPYHSVYGNNSNLASRRAFLTTGASPVQVFRNAIKETFNTKKWVKMFGGFGIGLFAVTVLAQFFFGKIATPKKEQK